MAATGEYQYTAVGAPDANPWVNASWAPLSGSGLLQVASNLLQCASVNFDLYRYTDPMTAGIPWDVIVEIGNNASGDGVICGFEQAAGPGYYARVSDTSLVVARTVDGTSYADVLISQTIPAPVSTDLLKFHREPSTNVYTVFINNVLTATTAADATVTTGMAPVIAVEWGNLGQSAIRSLAINGIQVQQLVLGGAVGRRRPVGRGPQMGRTPAVFRATAGSNVANQVLIQLFSAPGVPLANQTCTFYTATTEGGPSTDGPIVKATDGNGYVLLQGLTIGAGYNWLRTYIPGDKTRSRNFWVLF